jgi:hypothetical protein
LLTCASCPRRLSGTVDLSNPTGYTDQCTCQYGTG